MLKNVNEVNREPAHSEWCLVHVTLTRQNCLVTIYIGDLKSNHLKSVNNLNSEA